MSHIYAFIITAIRKVNKNLNLIDLAKIINNLGLLTGDRPSKPGVPVLHQLRGNINQVVWDEPVKENGAKVDLYWLEGQTDDSTREKREANVTFSLESDEEEDWVVFYNGSSNYLCENIYIFI